MGAFVRLMHCIMGMLLLPVFSNECCGASMPCVWTEHSTIKCDEQSLLPAHSDVPIHMRLNAARNEWETAQLLVRSDANELKDFRIQVGSLTTGAESIDPKNIDVRVAHYINFKCKDTASGEFHEASHPDPLAPFETSMTLSTNRTQAFYIQVYIPKATKAGKYRAPVVLSWEGGTQIVYLDVRVWNVTLPEKPQVITAFGLDRYMLATMYAAEQNSDEVQRQYEMYYEMMLDYGLTAYELPVPFDSPKAAKYANDPRVTSFLIGGAEWKTTESLTKTIELLKKNNWWNRTYFYPVDEPVTTQSYATLCEQGERFHRLSSDARVVAPFFRRPESTPNQTFIDLTSDVVKINCCCTNHYDDDTTVAQQMTTLAKNGDAESWWYVCCNPRAPYANLFVSQQGMEHRILPWQMKQYDISGLLYWRVNHWTMDDKGTDNPWKDMATVKDIDANLYGDGSLFYPGNKIGVDAPIPSVRMVNLRDGLEDFGLLCLLEKRLGKQKTLKEIGKLSKSLKEFSHDATVLESVREEILKQLSK